MSKCSALLMLLFFVGVEAAMNWLLEHSEDAPLNMSIPLQTDMFQADPSAIAMIVSMGFTESQARKALKETVSENY